MLKHFALSILIFTACTPLQKAKKMGYTVQVEYTPPSPPYSEGFFFATAKKSVIHLSTARNISPLDKYSVRNNEDLVEFFSSNYEGYNPRLQATNLIEGTDILHATYGSKNLSLVGITLQRNKMIQVIDTSKNSRIWYIKNKLRRSMLTSSDMIPIEIRHYEYGYPKTPTASYDFQQKTSLEKHYKIGDLIKIKPNVYLRLNSGFLVENNAGEIHIFLKLVCEKSDKFGRAFEKTELGFDLDCADTIPLGMQISDCISSDGRVVAPARFDTSFTMWDRELNIIRALKAGYEGKHFNAFFKSNIKSNEITPADTIPE
jgi:hypothetical protein